MSHTAEAFYSTPWAMHLPKLREVEAVVRSNFDARGRRRRSESGFLSVNQVRKQDRKTPKAGSGGDKPFLSSGRVAVLPLLGVVSQRMNLMTEISGGTSTQLFGRKLDAAVADPDVSTILLDVDSPGGSVFGTGELAAKVFEARRSKRVVAVVNSMMASAAYYIGSAANEIVMTPNGLVGSIGVYVAHEDVSEFEKQAGFKTTLIYAGKYKVDGNPYEPLTDQARERLQAQVDYYYTAFVNAVAKHRGTTPDAIRDGYGEGDVLTAGPALTAKLIDRVGTFEQVLREEVQRANQTDSLALARATQSQLELEN